MAQHSFLVNCLAVLQQALAPHEAAASYRQTLDEALVSRVAALVQVEAEDFLAVCQLRPKLEAIAAAEKQEVALCSIPELSPAAISSSLRLLFAALAGVDGQLPEFASVQVPRWRRQACEMVADAIWRAYSQLYQAVLNPENGYANPQSMFKHSPQDMKTILGLA